MPSSTPAILGICVPTLPPLSLQEGDVLADVILDFFFHLFVADGEYVSEHSDGNGITLFFPLDIAYGEDAVVAYTEVAVDGEFGSDVGGEGGIERDALA